MRKVPLLLLPDVRSLCSPTCSWTLTVEGCSLPCASCIMADDLASSMKLGNTTILGYQLRICRDVQTEQHQAGTAGAQEDDVAMILHCEGP